MSKLGQIAKMEILRENYINRLIRYKEKHIIKVITGVRRCGKSTILKQFKNALLENHDIKSSQIIEFDFSDDRLSRMTESQVHDSIISKSDKSKMNYVFLDEIQEIPQFERAVISLYEHKVYKYDIYITGSNSKMFSSSLATLLTGRNVEIKVYPLSFKEYMIFARNDVHLSKLSDMKIFNYYLTYGGMPMIINVFDDKPLIKEILSGILSDTINKDVKERHAIKTLPEFKRFTQFAIEHVGNIFSSQSISNYLKSKTKSKTSPKTIDRYLL
jgi:predicted AAA+ superfamily ATPase